MYGAQLPQSDYGAASLRHHLIRSSFDAGASTGQSRDHDGPTNESLMAVEMARNSLQSSG